MTLTAATSEIVYIEARESEPDDDRPRTNAELVAALRASTRELRADERVEVDIAPPSDPFGV